MASTRNRLFGLVAGVAGLAVALSGTAAGASPGGVAAAPQTWEHGRVMVNEPQTTLALTGPRSQAQRMFPEKVTERDQISQLVDLRFTIKLDALPTGNGTYVTAVTGREANDSDYRAKILIGPNGPVSLWIIDRREGVERVAAATVVKGMIFDESLPELSVHVEVLPVPNGIEMNATVWKTGRTEPVTPTLRDKEGTLQEGHNPGTIGVIAYASSTGDGGASTVQINNLTAVAAPNERYYSGGTVGDTGWTAGPGLSQEKSPLAAYPDQIAGVMSFDRAGQSRSTELVQDLPAREVEVNTSFSVDHIPSGRGATMTVMARKTAAGYYSAKMVYSTTGTQFHITKTVNGVETYLWSRSSSEVLKERHPYGISLRVAGTGSQAALGMAWGSMEANDPMLVVTDSQPELQVPGNIGMSGYVSSSATDPQTAMRIYWVNSRQLSS